MNIREYLLNNESQYSQKPAVIFKDKEVSFSSLKENVFKLANFLRKQGLHPSEKVAVFLPDNLEAVYSYLAVLSLGGVLVPFDFMLTSEEIINFINHSEARVLIVYPKKDIDLEKIERSCPSLKKIITSSEKEGFLSIREILEKESPDFASPDFKQEDLACILYTSGSTGHPKGVMLTFKHFDTPINCIKHFLDTSSKDVIFCAGVPFSHLGGFDYLLLMSYFSQTLVLLERFHPLEVLRYIEKYKVSFMWLVPSMYTAILSLKEYNKFDLSSLRYVVVFGAPSSKALLKRFHQVCPQAYLLNGWGMTETSAPNCVLPPGIDKLESIGKFYPGMQAKIVDEEGRKLGAEEQGELWVKGEGVMLGYYKEPQLTEGVLMPEGWLKTGDIAYYDKEGLFYIVGRKKDMIKVAGEIVFSPEVEEKIQLHPKVKEAAVVGIPDKLRGEVPKAFVVVKEGEALDEDELKVFLRKHLAHFKIPHYFEFLSQLPKTRTGKIDKKLLASLKTEV
ncbi:MAG: AMP-binding protein [Candidatus Omnitrophica bacterium]|nr:AMP-binding protein [Candidatus Omnitrophota bacterium]